jgi:hypothetical protein
VPKLPRQSSAQHQPPLVGRIVHALVIASGVTGVVWLAWTAGTSLVTKSALALLGGALFAFPWIGFYSPNDPERRLLWLIAVPGRMLLLIEIGLIILGGTALWLAWHRAAGETYWTVAFIDLVVRYTRVSRLWNNEPVNSGTEQ